MKEYHSIPACGHSWEDAPICLPCIAFDKLDGSNLRFGWYRKSGWIKFGTRHHLFDQTDPEYGQAIDIFLNKYADPIEKIIKENKIIRGANEVICFCEFFGQNSFAGKHEATDQKDLVLFDVNVHRKGIIPPRDFVNIFGHLHIPRIVYEGNLTGEFIKDVRESKYDVFEGVVCKGLNGKPPHGIWMYKIKTYNYRDELKRRISNWHNHWE